MNVRDKILAARRSHPLLAILLLAFLALAITYSVVTPIFEAGDEIWHYPYVQHLATERTLIVQDPAVKTLWAQEGGQPPLYYTLAALATFWIDTSDLRDRLWYNPHAGIGIPLLFGNKNMIVHTSAENFPWHNTALAVHLIRFLSILFSAGTVAFTYFLALEIGNDKALAAAAAAFVAFNPMFIFISASVNNDSLAAMLATLALLLLARLLTRGGTLQRFTVLGIVLGLAAMTKVSDLGLVVVAAVVFLLSLRRALATKQSPKDNLEIASQNTLAMTLTGSFLSAALVIVIAGWWYLRSYMLYNNPFAFNVWVDIAGGRPTPATLASLLNEFQGLRISFWGNFGGVNIIAPEWVYTALDALTGVAAIGLLLGLVRRALPRRLALPAFWLALIFIALVRWTMLTLASQGRLLFPAISAVGILLAYGLAQFRNYQLISRILVISRSKATRNLLPKPRFLAAREMTLRTKSHQSPTTRFVISHWLLLLPSAFLFLFALFSPFLLIAPTYALPKRLSADAIIPNPVHIVFEDQAELVGYNLPQKSVQPGAELPMTIYWRGIKPMTEDFSVYIHLFDASGNKVGQWDAYPGNGRYPTRLWQSGEVIVDSYRVPIALDARGPSVGRIEVGLYRRETLKNLIARDPQGRAITPNIARYKIAGQADVRVENPVGYDFGDQIALVGYSAAKETRAGDALKVRVYWRARKAPSEDYAVFVHVVDARGTRIAQKDDQPQQGAYPASFWDAGETVADEYVVEIPRDAAPGEYRIEIGVYRASDGARLPVSAGGDFVALATVRVTR